MAHIVILGAGIGGMPAAYEMREALDKAHAITVINEREHFQFVPSNPWLAVGWRKRDDVTFRLEPRLSRKGIGFIPKAVTQIDAQTNTLILNGDATVNYDYLVICTGPQLAFTEVAGAGPDGGHTHSVCTVEHAERAYADYQQLLRDPGPVVIGAMPFASCFGPAYEFAFIMDTDLRRRKLRKHVPMTFVTSEPYIGHLGLGGVGDSRGLLESALRERDIQWISNAKVTQVAPKKMLVDEVDASGRKARDHEVPFAFSMMLPAFRGVDAVAAVDGLCNPRGFVQVDEYQRNSTFPNIYSAGVCIAIPPVDSTPVPTGAPKTGYMIETMVSAIVRNIAAELNGKYPSHTGTWNAICLADMGDTGVAFVALPQIPPRNVNWMKSGKWVHVAKIAYEKYFMRKMKKGTSEPLYEKYMLKALGIERLESRA
ncbi:MAG: FAD/NAD(P)-binding oxidoreductase [Gammaproteobacteria bacterium]|jgi:sulfide:quinone oxidoreductase